jgi:aspartate aminotransferase-like enzyme
MLILNGCCFYSPDYKLDKRNITMSHMFIPGPVDVDPEVLKAQTNPMIPHRSAEFDAFFRGTEAKLKQVFITENRVFQPPSSGSGMQEASIRNLVHKDVLSCVNGAFVSAGTMSLLAMEKVQTGLTPPGERRLPPICWQKP